MHFLRVSNLVLFTVPLYVAARHPLFYDSSGTVGVVRRMVALNKAGAVFEFIMEEEEPERIDKLLSSALPDLSRSYLQKLVKEGAALVNKKEVKPNHKVNPGDVVEISVPEPELPDISPEDIPLDILYEDEEILVVNKPKGMVVHPAPGHSGGTLVNAVMYHCQGKLSGINGVTRPGIVHRIDRDTTGSLVICKSDRAHQALAEQLKEHSITRRYRAVVLGIIAGEGGTVNAPIGRHPTDRKKMSSRCKNGKPAVTHYRVLERFYNDCLPPRLRCVYGGSKGGNSKGYTYIECQLETGRTHQIRVHLSEIGYPILGDTVYGPAKCPFPLTGQTLHARILGFVHPISGEYMEFDAPLPEYFEELLRKMRSAGPMPFLSGDC